MTDVSQVPAAVVTGRAAPTMNSRTRRMLEAPIVPLLLGMAWPNMLIMLAQSSTGLIETWWISKLGTDALAGMALVFPVLMLMTMISAGAMGGGISSAVARALGAGRKGDADALVLHAIAINVVLGLVFAFTFIVFGRPIYHALGGDGAALEAALIYSDTVFACSMLIWLMNGLASVIRGTGNMLFPAVITCVGVLGLVPLSPLLIFGYGPVPALGIAGGALAMNLFYLAGTLAMGWHILAGRNAVHFRWVPLRWAPTKSILQVGLISSIGSILTNATIAGATALVASASGVAAVAGYGVGVRLEYLLIPLIFGIGAPMVAVVGANIGAGQKARALDIAMAGSVIACVCCEVIGLAAAIWPEQWLLFFSAEPDMIASGSGYLRIVGPAYGLYGLGMGLYFASQGAGRLRWPLVGGVVRMVIALGGGWLALRLTGSVYAIFAALSLALVVYGLILLAAVRGGAWFR